MQKILVDERATLSLPMRENVLGRLFTSLEGFYMPFACLIWCNSFFSIKYKLDRAPSSGFKRKKINRTGSYYIGRYLSELMGLSCYFDPRIKEYLA